MSSRLRLDDDNTIQAIGILADVLDDFSGSTALECTLVSKALRQVQATRSQIGMDFASRAFATLDPDVRRQIRDEAEDKAMDAVNTVKLPKLRAPRPDAPIGNAEAQPTGLLNALNSRGRTKTVPPPPRKG